jgi:hypothetical protein
MADANAKVLTEAAASPIASYRWKNRGQAPTGYIGGMALAFAETYRGLNSGDPVAAEMAAAPSGDDRKDVLDWYAGPLIGAGTRGDSASDRLNQLFTIMLGLGMRESSGKHCEGRDMSAANVSADTAEAGLFQVSYNSITGHETLARLFETYKGRKDLLGIFEDGVQCSAKSWTGWGEGPGREFQELTKTCPAFAVAYAGVLLRRLRTHWGPIARKEVEVLPDAAALFLKVKTIVDGE